MSIYCQVASNTECYTTNKDEALAPFCRSFAPLFSSLTACCELIISLLSYKQESFIGFGIMELRNMKKIVL